MTIFSSDAQAKRNVAVLIFAQAILGCQMPIIFILAGLAGQSLAENICYATLPISVIIIGSIPGAPMISSIMQRYGRKVGFFIGAGAGAIGAIIGSFGLYYDSFTLFLLGSLFTGIYMSPKGFTALPPPIPPRIPFARKPFPMFWPVDFWQRSLARNWPRSPRMHLSSPFLAPIWR